MYKTLAAVLLTFPLLGNAAATPEVAVAQLWKASSHAPGVAADTATLERLFRSDAVVAGGRYASGTPVFQATKAVDFIQGQRQARPHGFYECEVSRQVIQYDRFATVYSVVETRRDPAAPKADYTGVNSIQLYRDDTGWKIFSLFYHVEKAGLPIPLDGGKTGACLDA